LTRPERLMPMVDPVWLNQIEKAEGCNNIQPDTVTETPK